VTVDVNSEIGKIRQVIVHRPGVETQRYPHGDFLQVFPLRPGMSSFNLEEAEKEFSEFNQVLRSQAVEVFELTDLLVEALDASPLAREDLISSFLRDASIRGNDLQEAARVVLVAASSNGDLVRRLFSGIRYEETTLDERSAFPLAFLTGNNFDSEGFLLGPLNTAFFVRDPMNVVGEGVTLNRMYWPFRGREVVLYEIIKRYHPLFSGVPQWYDHGGSFYLEGGDVVNIDARTVALGMSSRTEATAIDVLCQRLLWGGRGSQVDDVFVFTVPQEGNRVHLDAYLSRIDYDKFLVDPLLQENASVYRVRRGYAQGDVRVELLTSNISTILGLMVKEVGVRVVEFGNASIGQMQREYENGSLGTLCLSPGNLCVCKENVWTNDALDKVGMTLHPVSIQELTAGFGGPSSLCLPLWREKL